MEAMPRPFYSKLEPIISLLQHFIRILDKIIGTSWMVSRSAVTCDRLDRSDPMEYHLLDFSHGMSPPGLQQRHAAAPAGCCVGATCSAGGGGRARCARSSAGPGGSWLPACTYVHSGLRMANLSTSDEVQARFVTWISVGKISAEVTLFHQSIRCCT